MPEYEWVFEQFGVEDAQYVSEAIGSIAQEGMIGAELGSFTGFSSISIANVVKPVNGKLICVDRWDVYPDESSYLNQFFTSKDMFGVFRNNIKLAGVDDCIIPIVGDSKVIHRFIADGSLDFLFIDCDHKYAGILADLQNWFPKIRSGGIICGHDYEYFYEDKSYNMDIINAGLSVDFHDSMHCGVIKALNEVIGRENLTFGGTSGWYYRIP